MIRSVQLRCILVIFVTFAVIGLLLQPGIALAQPITYPLIQPTDLVYQGAFRLPSGTIGASSFAYGGTAAAYNPANNSLFIVGHDQHQQVAEIKIPQIINSAQLSNLATVSVLQPFIDATEGKRQAINPSDPNAKKVGGVLVHDGQLYISSYSYYDGAGTQSASHFVRPIKLSTIGQVKGPFRVGNQPPGFVSGYMISIPPEWQSAFGGPALTGNCCLGVISRTSYGPAAFVFDPADLGTKNPVPATPLVYYPQSHPTIGDWNASWNPSNGVFFNGTTVIRGIVFPHSSRSVLFFGTQGIGAFCYGPGTNDPSLVGRPSGKGVEPSCYDPDNASKGTHGYPYAAEVWAYDANDLLAVKNGQKQPWQVTPYATWTLTLPFGSAAIGGAAYEPQTGRIFLSQQYADHVGHDPLPVIHVFTVKNFTAAVSKRPSPRT